MKKKKKTAGKCLSRDETGIADMSYRKTNYKGENKQYLLEAKRILKIHVTLL